MHEQSFLDGELSLHAVDACGSHSSAIEKTNAGTTKDEKPKFASFERSIVVKPDDPHVRHTLEESQQSIALSSDVAADAISDVRVVSDFSLNSSSAPIKVAFSKKGNHGRATKVTFMFLIPISGNTLQSL